MRFYFVALPAALKAGGGEGAWLPHPYHPLRRGSSSTTGWVPTLDLSENILRKYFMSPKEFLHSSLVGTRFIHKIKS